jgi:hypothetical protein
VGCKSWQLESVVGLFNSGALWQKNIWQWDSKEVRQLAASEEKRHREVLG